jgi:hypothetical protein
MAVAIEPTRPGHKFFQKILLGVKEVISKHGNDDEATWKLLRNRL